MSSSAAIRRVIADDLLTGKPRPAPPLGSVPMYSGPRPTLQAIYQQHFSFVWSTARNLGATMDVVDDVVQDVFIVVHFKLDSLRQVESIRSWLYGITRRTLSEYRRACRNRSNAEARLSTELRTNHPVQASPHDLAEQHADLDRLQTLLAELDEKKREVFVMVEVLGMTIPEVVEVIDVPLDTAYSRLRKARQAFEAALLKHEEASQAPATGLRLGLRFLCAT
jgi:RNA polymerase sigma-70 factor (ECF subfamily)